MRTLVRDLMTADVAAVQPDTPARTVAELLANRQISAMPVVDHDCHVVGVVSEVDVLHHLHTDQTAGTMMSSPAITVLADQSADVAAHLMEQHGVKRLPVVDDMGRLAGIVSRSDLIRAYARGRLPSVNTAG
ncbi:MAG TPA: CBS domain-containing protein [Jiangellaceae bacterium]